LLLECCSFLQVNRGIGTIREIIFRQVFKSLRFRWELSCTVRPESAAAILSVSLTSTYWISDVAVFHYSLSNQPSLYWQMG
jgi:hypothetical protein